ncbi:MAG: hypothetical protein IPI55_05360 [Flavobacteriales bacterium]|nr:hypothetical protein [Flavobacteriales bacterium]
MAYALAALEKKLSIAQAHYPAVEHSMRLRCGLLRSAMAKDATTKGEDAYPFRHKGQEWRCRVRLGKDGDEVHALFWWFHGRKEGHEKEALDALMLRPGLQALHFDSHFWSRWGLRSERMGVMITNLMGFHKQYPQLTLRNVHRFYPAQPEYAAALDQGLLLGRANGKRLISCDTFKNHELMSAEEKALWKMIRKMR